MTIKRAIFTHRSLVSLVRFTFCWWCHNQMPMTSQWPDNCDAITWIVISNSLLAIDFIHDRSWKKKYFLTRIWKLNHISASGLDVADLGQRYTWPGFTHPRVESHFTHLILEMDTAKIKIKFVLTMIYSPHSGFVHIMYYRGPFY